MGRPALQAAMEGLDPLLRELEFIIEELKVATLLAGATAPAQLRDGRYVLLGRTLEWVEQRGPADGSDPDVLADVREALAPLPTEEGGTIVVMATPGRPPAVAMLSTGDVLVGADRVVRATVYGGPPLLAEWVARSPAGAGR